MNRNSFQDFREYFDGTNHEISSTKTNLEKGDASAEKLNEARKARVIKQAFLHSFQWEDRFLLKENKILVPEIGCFQVIKTTLTVEHIRGDLVF